MDQGHESSPSPAGLTRRHLVQAGLAGAASASLGTHAFESVAEAATYANPELLRSTYLSLSSSRFQVDTATAGVHTLELLAVEDLPVAAVVPALRDNENAFSVSFAGPVLPPLSQAPTITHPEIGTFPLFITAVERADQGVQHYEAIVDSVVHPPPLHANGAPGPVDPGPRATGPASTSTSSKPVRLRRAELRRSASKRKLVADLAFSASPRVKVVRAVLRRRGSVVARTTGRARSRRIRLAFAPGRHVRTGHYELTIFAVDAAGRVTRIVTPLVVR